MARSFNGTSDKITIASGFEAAPAGPISIACWINLNSSGGANNRWAIIGPTLTSGMEFRATGASPNSKLELLAANAVSLATSTGTFAVSSWVHAGVTFNNTTFAYVFYINGVASGSGTAASGLSTGKGPYAIGENVVAASDFWAGSLADYAQWNGTALTATEFAGLANGARPWTIGAAPTLWVPMDGLQSPEPDLSGNAFNGTLVGTALAAGPPYMQFTPRWPQFNPAAAAPTFNPAWALNSNRISDGLSR